METSDKLLEVDELVKVFSFGSLLSRTHFTAVDKISFHIDSAEIFALAGESGCGKTTTARIILGFEHPTSGTIVHSGKKEAKNEKGLADGRHPGHLSGPVRHIQPTAHRRQLFL